MAQQPHAVCDHYQLRKLVYQHALGRVVAAMKNSGQQVADRYHCDDKVVAHLSKRCAKDRRGLSPSILTRLARSLGYSGFPALQQVLLSASMRRLPAARP